MTKPKQDHGPLTISFQSFARPEDVVIDGGTVVVASHEDYVALRDALKNEAVPIDDGAASDAEGDR